MTKEFIMEIEDRLLQAEGSIPLNYEEVSKLVYLAKLGSVALEHLDKLKEVFNNVRSTND